MLPAPWLLTKQKRNTNKDTKSTTTPKMNSKHTSQVYPRTLRGLGQDFYNQTCPSQLQTRPVGV